MTRLLILLSLISLFAFHACNSRIKDKDEVVLARVFDNYLYESDLSGITTENTSHRDSIVMVRNYVNNWIKTKLMVEKARFNLTKEQLDFEQRLEDYENSLIIFEYESKLISQTLDTSISEIELKTFYTYHLSDFELKENIVKVLYSIVEKDLPEKDLIENTFSLADSLVIDSLETLSDSLSFITYLDTSTWINFYDLKKIIPIETYNQELFLKNKRFVKISDDNYCYLMKFVDFRITDDTSPFELVENNIRDIILAKRKIGLVKKAREQIFDQAAINNDFEIYYHEEN